MDSQKRVLLTLARSAISEVLCIPYTLNFEQLRKENPWLEDECASFVTITIDNGKLRGCIGSLISHRKLYIDVMLNAKSAAMNDPRFPSLSVKEFEDIKIEVSMLTQPKKVIYNSIEMLKSKIRVGVDGVILKHGSYQATLLPQVWEELSTFDSFFSHLCQKSGMCKDGLNSNPQIFTYQVEKYSEN